MDYSLRRQPDGTVNAQPGDAVEVWIAPCEYYPQGTWETTNYLETADTSDAVVIEMYSPYELCEVKRRFLLEHVRHARGGAGWHRLREARLRAVVEAIAGELENWDQGHIKPYGGLISSAIAALADLDNAEPEA